MLKGRAPLSYFVGGGAIIRSVGIRSVGFDAIWVIVSEQKHPLSTFHSPI